MTALTFAVLADSHFHAEGPKAGQQQGYQSDASFNARNTAVLSAVQAAQPAFVIHLGDLPHPIPGLAAHQAALDVAKRTFAGLSAPLHVVPGNHDVGDKPQPWAPAPSVSVDKHAVFQANWGPPWWSFDYGGMHFLGLDTPVLNSALALEDHQWAWLEADLTAASGRVFAFMHYPPFLLSADEDEHYDNLAQPARARLLELLAKHSVEAAFCGHIHHPFINWHRGTAWYLLPSTTFVRPGYAELARVGPGDGECGCDCGAEYGRNERGRLGWCLVHVDEDSHRVEWVRSEGVERAPCWAPGLAPGASATLGSLGPRCPLAITLRHAWDAVADVPADNLDPFRRKWARNDLSLLLAVQLGRGTLRLPLEDLRRPATRLRLVKLPSLGLAVVLFTTQGLAPADVELLARHRDAIDAIELIAPRHWLSGTLPGARPPQGMPLWLSVHGQAALRDDAYFDHFPAPGFAPQDPLLATLPACDGVVFRVPSQVGPWEGVSAAVSAAAASGEARMAVAQVLLPRLGEGRAFVDDQALACRVAEAALCAVAWPQARVQLDGFVDHDRGYYPRHGLVDRRGDPRPAWHVLRNLGRLLPEGCRVQRVSHPAGRAFQVDGLGLVLLPEHPTRLAGVDLVTGQPSQQPTAHPLLLA